MTYPLATLACTINADGISAPSYSDIFASLQASAQIIFGADVYLASDSQDGQLLGVFAQAINDSNNATIADYNARSPLYASGAALDAVVQVNGVTRNVATHSTCPVDIGGVAGTVIANGVVSDTANNLWNLPASVTIGSGGTVTVTATAQQPGAILSPIGTLTGIFTPTRGWQTVTNSVSGEPGAPVQSDASLRIDQAQSVGAPSQSVDGGILGGVLAVAGVQAAWLYDNDTDTTDGNGIPPHSIAVVVGGGAVQDIVNAIGVRKTPGTGMQGNTSGTYTDPIGLTKTITYWTLVVVPVQVQVTLSTLPGYNSSTAALIQEAVAAYINTLAIGATVRISKLYSPANLTGSVAIAATGLSQAQLDEINATYEVTSIEIGPYPGSVAPTDYPVTYIQQAQCTAAHVTVVP